MQAALRSRGGKIAGVAPYSNPERKHGSRVGWGSPPLYSGLEGLESYAAAFQLQARLPVFFPAAGFFAGFWFLARRSAIREVGEFDERYGLGGFEDLDLQWRLRRAGYRLGFAGRCYVHHVDFGCAQRNGLKKVELYGRRRAALLHEKFPAAAGVEYGYAGYWLNKSRAAAALRAERRP
jgi:GT2 family glycosyltransferase